ncbi:hypothetical protein SAMN04515695_2338 [Pseudovibrio sp. Tun.PSC04-5.I4]|nr:hypothetical protein SAMN04515695_2338 [Pseudovibrio sp. Tun.PSC04-5.I4]
MIIHNLSLQLASLQYDALLFGHSNQLFNIGTSNLIIQFQVPKLGAEER